MKDIIKKNLTFSEMKSELVRLSTDESNRKDHNIKQVRRQVRYWCFRFKTEESGACKADGAPKGIRKHFEDNDYFLGWKNFNESNGWDVSHTEPLELVPLRMGSDDAWNKELEKSIKELPKKEEKKKSTKKKKGFFSK